MSNELCKRIKKDQEEPLVFSDDVGSAREKGNQGIIQQELSWGIAVKGMKLLMVGQSSLEDQ